MKKTLHAQTWSNRARGKVNFQLLYLQIMDQVRSSVYGYIEETVYSELHNNFRTLTVFAMEDVVRRKIEYA